MWKKMLEIFIIGLIIFMLLSITISPMKGLGVNNKIRINTDTYIEDNYISFHRINDYKELLNKNLKTKTGTHIFENCRDGEVVDQQQTSNCGSGWGVLDTQWIAQGFTPRLEVLTKVQLYMFKTGVVTDIQITVSIRDSLDGNDLTKVSVNASPLQFIPIWLEFDFADINVTPGHTYYIVARAPEADDLNGTFWDFDINNPYEGGNASVAFYPKLNWIILDWPDLPECDCCFMTYGLDDPPGEPDIDGTTKGETGTAYDYNFTATDPDEHDVKYIINWGDGDIESTDLNPSGTTVTVNHTWAEKGDYKISVKAEDEYGLEGPEGTIQVTMPKNKIFNFNFPLLNWLFEQFQNAFPILRYLVGL